MNYGFKPSPNDNLLMKRLSEYIRTLPDDNQRMHCYTEKTKNGVRVRRITHYSADMQQSIVDNCERIYAELFPSN